MGTLRRMRIVGFGRDGVRALAAVRVGIGAAMLARPELLPRTLGVDAGTAARVSWLVRMLGAREVALGAGTLAAARRGDARDWILAEAVSDAVDALAFAGAAERGHANPVYGALFAATAATSAASCVAALRPAPAAAG
jgi:hypothetical protein